MHVICAQQAVHLCNSLTRLQHHHGKVKVDLVEILQRHLLPHHLVVDLETLALVMQVQLCLHLLPHSD